MVDLSNGNDSAQVRMMAEQIADAAISRFAIQHPEVRKTDIPAPLKWAAGIASAVMAALATAGLFWVGSAISSTQLTVARMDERLASLANSQEQGLVEIRGRVSELEDYHRHGGGTR